MKAVPKDSQPPNRKRQNEQKRSGEKESSEHRSKRTPQHVHPKTCQDHVADYSEYAAGPIRFPENPAINASVKNAYGCDKVRFIIRIRTYSNALPPN